MADCKGRGQIRRDKEMRKESVEGFLKDPYELYKVYIISSLWVRSPRFSKFQLLVVHIVTMKAKVSLELR